MLEYLIEKYRKKDTEQVVYRLSYGGKFIIVKARTMCGSMIIINLTFIQYNRDKPRFIGHLYKHLYDHYIDNPGGRFRVKTLAKVGRKMDQYGLLKREQMELDKFRKDPKCLNNQTEAYIPQYDESADQFGWLNRSAVMNFKRWLVSKERKAYIKRYGQKKAAAL